VEWLIFDEADKLFEMKFIEQIDTIIAECPAKNRKICLFSATMIPAVEQLAAVGAKYTLFPVYMFINCSLRNTATDTIKQRLMFVGSEEGKLLAIKQLIRQVIDE
jgi:ATP-dependent RNA helicase DDX52/ROK1